jgi:hypothetical protein
MTTHSHKNEKQHNGPDANNSLFNLFAKHEGFWWPYRSFAKALLGTQKNASAYLEANRKLMDEMRDIVRKEQDVALEISEKTLERAAETSRPPNGGTMSGDSEVYAMFERATTGLREIGQAWVDAQVRSLDAMRSHASGTHQSTATRRHDTSTAAQ